jgi:pyridoxal phosphate enzyme (YggS family)
MGSIKDNYKRLRELIPEDVSIVVASKTRTLEEIEEVIEAGATIIGENYVYPEALNKYISLGEIAKKVKWHLIGPLQKNKINKALQIFNLIQTIDSLKISKEINKRANKAGKSVIQVLLEINSGREETKSGFLPDFEVIKNVILEMEKLKHINIRGLMTMGPMFGDPENARVYFKIARDLFEKIKDINTKKCKMEILSMGMSNSYRVAIEEGSNMVRIGTLIFGERVK